MGDKMKKYEFLLFDADNTLLDFDANERISISNTLRHFKIEPDEPTVELYHTINKNYWRMYDRREISRDDLLWMRFETLYKTLGVTVNPHETEDYYRLQLGLGNQLIDGALELCSDLRKTHKIYIVTNGVGETQHGRIKGSGLSEHIDGLFISDEIGFHKPQKEFFDYVADHIEGFKRDAAIVIGDSITSDIKGGIESGIDTCWYNPHKSENGTKYIPTYEVRDYETIKRICEG